MALTDEQKLNYIIPLVVDGTQAIDDGIATLGQQLHDTAQATFDQGIGVVQPLIESAFGKALNAAQVAQMRSQLASRLNETLRTLTVS